MDTATQWTESDKFAIASKTEWSHDQQVCCEGVLTLTSS